MKTLLKVLAIGAPAFASAQAFERHVGRLDGIDAPSMEGRIRARGALLPIRRGVELHVGMEQLSTETGPDATRFRAGGATLIRRFGTGPFGLGVGVRFLSGRVHAENLNAPVSEFALTAPFTGVSLRQTRVGPFTMDGSAGVSFARLNAQNPFQEDASREEGLRPIATLSFRARF